MGADILLFTAGMFGVNAALLAVPDALEILRWLGVVFLGWLSVLAFSRVARGRNSMEASTKTVSSSRAVILTTLAVTLLNPQVYLDTLLLIPAIGAQQSSTVGFLAGASSASVLWFGLIAFSGAALSPWLAKPKAWRFIDGAIGAMMALIAVHLARNGL